MKQLTGGHYFGQTVRRESVAGLVLTETRYAPRQRVPVHSHERAYMCFIRRGDYTERFAAQTREVVPHTLACHPPGERHTQEIHAAEVSSFNVEFPAAWATRLDDQCPILSRPAVYDGDTVVALSQKLYREFRHTDKFSILSIEGLVLELLAEVGRMSERTHSRRPPTWLKRIREVLDEQFEQSLTLGALATLAGVHPVHLAASFRKHCGTTIGEYVRQRRVEFARRQLLRTDEPIASIAIEAGFADQSHLTRVFRRAEGTTPAQLRRSSRDRA